MLTAMDPLRDEPVALRDSLTPISFSDSVK